LKPNAFTNDEKTAWLKALDGRVASDVFLWPPAELAGLDYSFRGDKGSELLVGPPYDDIYVMWLAAQIDAANGEFNRYQNSMQLFNENYGAFVRWFAGLYDPSQGYLAHE